MLRYWFHADSCAAYIKGTVNEPTEFPKPDPYHGSFHWDAERIVSVAMVPAIAAAAVKHGQSGILDGSLSLLLLLHSHMGFGVVLTDYVDVRKYPVAGRVSSAILALCTLGAGYGLYGASPLGCVRYADHHRI